MSKRSFEAVWDSDACVFNCLAHRIFNLTSPKSGVGFFAINSTAEVVDVKVANSTSSVLDIGAPFGCQRHVGSQVVSNPSYFQDVLHTHLLFPSRRMEPGFLSHGISSHKQTLNHAASFTFVCCLLQKPTVPKYIDDGSQWAGPVDWPDATVNSTNRTAGVDYDALNNALARYFEDPALVNSCHTKAIAVIYKVRLHVGF